MMTKRKTALLAGIAVLLCAFIAQTIGAHRSPVKEFTLAEEPDTITIVSAANGTVTLTRTDDDLWLVNGAPSEENATYILARAIQNVRTLGTASRANGAADVQRYGLDDKSKITVTAKKNGTVLRTFTLGKTATNADQTYIRVDASTETLLAAGNLHGQFDVKAEDLLAQEEEGADDDTAE